MMRTHLGSSRTGSLSISTWAPFLYSLLFLLFFIGILEFLTRQPFVEDRLSFPRLGSRHSQIGAKYTRIQTSERAFGHIDCIAIGSSTMDQAFDPVMFAKVYQSETGRAIHCFNFAIDAITPSANSKIAKILVEDFQPHLLIIGIDARDLTVSENDRDVTVVSETPWVRHRSGSFDIGGCLMEHLYSFRYAWHIEQLLRGQSTGVMRQVEAPSVALGQTPEVAVDRMATLQRYPYEGNPLAIYYHERLGNFQILPENTNGLKQMLALNDLGRQVLLVEMPVPPSYFGFFSDPGADYNAFLDQVQQLADEAQLPFWRTTELDIIPDDGWFDFSHVNVTGAEAFSRWLGHKVGALQ